MATPLPTFWTIVLGAIAAVSLAVIGRLAFLIPAVRRRLGLSEGAYEGRPLSNTRKVAIMLGSGGHTTEMLQLLSALPAERYTPLLFLISSGDALSAAKAREAVHLRSVLKDSEISTEAAFDLIEIPRARRVHQPLYLAPASTLRSLATCVRIVWPSRTSTGEGPHLTPFANLLVMNGPGTCVPLVLAVYLMRFLGHPTPRMLYVESFARVTSLSLTGKMLQPLVDRFVVQWETAGGAQFGRAEYKGWLI